MTAVAWDPRAKPVLITGCSSGIGRATAVELIRAGYTVYATARRIASLDELTALGARPIELDVLDPDSIEAAVARVEDEEGAIGVLVNNAGYSQSGAVETISDADARRQLDTNLLAPIALARRALPAMRERGAGRIINMSSMGGKLVFPGGGWYHASKHGLEAISDSMRYELAGFGIDVVLIEPGLIRTGFADRAAQELPEAGHGPYTAFNATVGAVTSSAYEKGIGARLGGGPETVARTVRRAIETRRPKTRYPVTASARVFLALHAMLTDRGWDRQMRRSFPQPTREDG